MARVNDLHVKSMTYATDKRGVYTARGKILCGDKKVGDFKDSEEILADLVRALRTKFPQTCLASLTEKMAAVSLLELTNLEKRFKYEKCKGMKSLVVFYNVTDTKVYPSKSLNPLNEDEGSKRFLEENRNKEHLMGEPIVHVFSSMEDFNITI